MIIRVMELPVKCDENTVRSIQVVIIRLARHLLGMVSVQVPTSLIAGLLGLRGVSGKWSANVLCPTILFTSVVYLLLAFLQS